MSQTAANDGLTPVYLSAEEAASFKEWRRNQETFQILVDIGVFDTRNGEALLTFNANGVLVSVRKEQEAWRRKRKKSWGFRSYPHLRH